MSQLDSVSRRQFLCEAASAGLLVATGTHANLASASVEIAASAEIHVDTAKGDDSATGSVAQPLKTISAAAKKAMPGDTVVVHAGIYREWVIPPRGGTSDSKRITYRAAPGEKVVITGSDLFTGWKKISGDTWKLVIPNTYFGKFNPYAENVSGDWFDGQGRDTGAKIVQKADGWYLTFATDEKWRQAAKCPLVTTALLGKAKIPQQGYALADGSPMAVDTDYLGAKRDASNPFPGPFENPLNGEVKVWPKRNV